MKKIHFVAIAALALATAVTQAQTTYFLVAERAPLHGDSYVLPLTKQADIDYARAIINGDPNTTKKIVVADIAYGADGINRDYLSPTKHQWNWHVTSFSGFAQMTIEILDGWPTYVNTECLMDGAVPNSAIGFWGYTVVAELGRNPNPWGADFDRDNYVNFNDWFILNEEYWMGDCASNHWCIGTDLNHDGVVDLSDVLIFADAWLSSYASWPLWFTAWNCPTQCHGNTDCTSQMGFAVYLQDLNRYVSMYGRLPVYYGDFFYDPSLDFDRDGDIDDIDGNILETWFGKKNVPADCPTQR